MESSDAKSVISIDPCDDLNPSDNDDYEQFYIQANKNDQSMGTIDEFSQSQRTNLSRVEDVAGFMVEDNPPDPNTD